MTVETQHVVTIAFTCGASDNASMREVIAEDASTHPLLNTAWDVETWTTMEDRMRIKATFRHRVDARLANAGLKVYLQRHWGCKIVN